MDYTCRPWSHSLCWLPFSAPNSVVLGNSSLCYALVALFISRESQMVMRALGIVQKILEKSSGKGPSHAWHTTQCSGGARSSHTSPGLQHSYPGTGYLDKPEHFFFFSLWQVAHLRETAASLPAFVTAFTAFICPDSLWLACQCEE